MTTALTPKQTEVLAYMREFLAENDQLPPNSAMRARFGWSSDNAAFEVIAALAKKGYLERNAVGKYRFTRSAACASTAESA